MVELLAGIIVFVIACYVIDWVFKTIPILEEISVWVLIIIVGSIIGFLINWPALGVLLFLAFLWDRLREKAIS